MGEGDRMDALKKSPHADLASASEAVARGWALLVGVGASLALPAVHLTRDNDDGYADDVSNPATLLSTIPRVVFRSVDGFQRSGSGNLDVKLVLLRIALMLTLVGLLVATALAVRWIARGSIEAVPTALRVLTGLSLVGSSVLTALVCGQIERPDEDGVGLVLGVDAGGGLLMVLFCAMVLLAEEVAHSWSIAQRHD